MDDIKIEVGEKPYKPHRGRKSIWAKYLEMCTSPNCKFFVPGRTAKSMSATLVPHNKKYKKKGWRFTVTDKDELGRPAMKDGVSGCWVWRVK